MIPISKPDIGDRRGAGRPRCPSLGHDRDGPQNAPSSRRRGPPTAACGTPCSWPTVPWRSEAVLRALGIGPGDEVITVSFTFNATVSAMLQAGARPVFVDVRADDFCMDPERVEAAITPRTKAIMPVHLYGLMADMDPLVAIAERHGITIVEDAAQAHGATLSRPTRRTVRARDVQPVRDQEPDDRRGRLGHDRRRRARRAASSVPQPRHARALRPRGAGHQLQAHGHRGRAGAGTARAPRRADRAAPARTPPASAQGWTAT